LDVLPKTVIVVPCFNEAHRLQPQAFVQSAAEYAWLHFLFVDDGSSDDTPAALERLRAACPGQIRVLCVSDNRGKAAAVRRGVLAALETDAVIVGFWDADLATPLGELRPMCELLLRRDAFMVIGSRVKLLGRRIDRQPARHYLGRVFATCASLLLDLSVYDTQCGAKIFRCDERARALFSEPFLTRWVFDVELLARLMTQGRRGEFIARARVLEHPLQTWIDVGGSKLTHAGWARVALELALVVARYRLSDR
jgi:dolichyl-phosphate beta-glucosyltransferase